MVCRYPQFTHVFVNDPTKGYGISIQDMLETAEIEDKAA
ncbi:MAG: SpoIVB peptidase S55 domain-containing protein [Faecousia sp.]